MTWFEDDDDIVQCEVNSDGLKDGRYVSIDKEDGEIVIQRFKNDLEHGMKVQVHSDGSKEILTFIDGEMKSMIFCDETGEVVDEAEY